MRIEKAKSKGERKMTHWSRKIPEYYPTMYLDGFSPEQISWALKKKMYADYLERQTTDKIHITTEVKIK